MKKKVLLITVLLFISSFLFAAPFGLKMGMNLNEIAQACDGQRPENVKDDCYRIYPEKKHPLFEEYYAYVDDVEGLYYIKAVSERIASNSYGTELKEKFNEINARISKTYGVTETKDEILDNSSYDAHRDNHWMDAIYDGSRQLSAKWQKDSPMKDSLVYVSLYASVPSWYSSYGLINLEYRFTNADAVEDSQDDVF